MQETRIRKASKRKLPPREVQYDYDNQAWIVNGVYDRCGHPDDVQCKCYGRIHEGEKAPSVH